MNIITTFEQFWYVLAMGLVAFLIWMIKYAITKYIDYHNDLRVESAKALLGAQKAIASLQLTIKEFQGVMAQINSRCEWKHAPIDNSLNMLNKKKEEHELRIADHESRIIKLEKQ